MYSERKQQLFDFILALILVILSVLLYQFQGLTRSDNLFYDLESAKITSPVDENIVIVAIDDASLKKLGRWPWSRAIHARMLNRLSTSGVKAIGMDILFMEPDILHPENDQLLADAILKNNNVVLPVLTTVQNGDIYVTESMTKIADAAAQGHVNLHFDEQGIVRKINMRHELTNGDVLPSMALALSQKLNKDIKFTDFTTKEPTLIAFANPTNQFQKISFSDVLLNVNIRQNLQGKVVLIGMTATGLGTRIATSVSKNHRLMSGIEFQANALSAIQSGRIIQTISWTTYALLSFFLIVFPVIFYQFLKPATALLLTLIFLVLTVTGSFLLLKHLNLWLAPSSILFCLVLTYPLWTLRRLEQLGDSLYKEHENASATLRAIGDAVITTDKQGCIEFMNPAAEKILACPLEKAKNRQFTDVCQIVKKDESTILASHFLTAEEQRADAKIIRNQNKIEYAVRMTCSPFFSVDGTQVGCVYALTDLTEIISINKKIAYIATHDDLTGLANRTLIQDLMEQAISSATRDNLIFAVLFIDLDGFKKVNDGMGHGCGDLLLQNVAKRLQACVRQSDTTARWGGDEFIVLLDKLTYPSDAADVSIKIKKNLAMPFKIRNQEVFITPSIGISLFPVDGRQVNFLIARADTAMYNIKLRGKNNFCFYSHELESQAKEKLILDAELRQALQSNEFKIYYQPQVDLNSDRLIGMEALIRWQHPEKGMLTPDQFIPLAEETGLIVPIGEWLVKTLCQQLESWQHQGLPVIQVAINLSARQFLQKDLVSVITHQIDKHGISTDSLQIEITESMMIHDLNQVINIMNEFKAAGISIAIDDFGTGYSSLEYLKRLPIDKLKIDKSFIGNVLHNSDDASIVQAVIAMGHNMNMQIIAEGVETKEQATFLHEQKCDFAQGYYFSKPVSAASMREKIEQLSCAV